MVQSKLFFPQYDLVPWPGVGGVAGGGGGGGGGGVTNMKESENVVSVAYFVSISQHRTQIKQVNNKT